MISGKQPMNGVDTAWLRMDSATNLMVVNAMLVLDEVKFSDFKAALGERLIQYPRFSRCAVHHTNGYYWEDDSFFSLDNHIHRVALPGDADKRELQDFIASHLSLPLPQSKPLWQIYFVENYSDGVAVLIRIHHAYADGIALISLFQQITDERAQASAQVKKIHPLPTAANEAVRNDLYPWPNYQLWLDSTLHTLEACAEVGRRVGIESMHLMHHPDMLGGYFSMGAKALAEIGRLALRPSDTKTLLKRPLGVQKRCAWSAPVPLSTFKTIAGLLGCKINDLLLSCVAGALREEMLAAGDKIDCQKIHVTVPVNIRQDDFTKDRDLEHHLGNHFGTVFVPLPVGIENPIERIYTLKHDMDALKQSVQPGVSYGLLYAAGMMPKQIQKPLLEMFSRKSSAVLSNVPGTRERRYIAGACIREQMFWVPQTGEIGLGLSIISYAGQVQFGLICDSHLFDDPDRVVNRCQAQLAQHHPEHLLDVCQTQMRTVAEVVRSN